MVQFWIGFFVTNFEIKLLDFRNLMLEQEFRKKCFFRTPVIKVHHRIGLINMTFEFIFSCEVSFRKCISLKRI